MSASRLALSFHMIETNIENKIAKTIFPVIFKRHLCMKCKTGRPHQAESLVVSSKKTFLRARHDLRRNISLKTSCVLPTDSSSNSAPQSRPLHDAKQGIRSSFIRSSSDGHIAQLLKMSFSSFSRHQIRSLHHNSRPSSSSSNATVTNPSPALDPFKLMEEEINTAIKDIRTELVSTQPVLQHMSQYYFNGKGKTFRPLVALLMARACNIHSQGDPRISWQQKTVAMVSEMIHTASLVHDDVIDASDTRRSQVSLNQLYGQRQAILTGDFILSRASMAIARTNHPQVISILASILVDLVSGEFMQLGSKEKEKERFTHYFDKTYKKTASLIANCCKSVSILADCDESVVEASFLYGKNLGLAFQLIDDLLDFTSCDMELGKPTAADLKQGLATAPVLFATQEFPDLHAMIMRRFSQDGDVEFARNAVEKSKGVEQTFLLATKHSQEAVRSVHTLRQSEARAGLLRLAHILLQRKH